jgi:hypothetical protein
MSIYKKRVLGWSALAVVCGLMSIIYERAPPNTFNPFCTYDLTYRLNVTIEADGKQYSSKVVHQLSRPRKWVNVVNSNFEGCPQARGKILLFRLADNRLVGIKSDICWSAVLALADTPYAYDHSDDFAQAMKEHRRVDVTSFCMGLRSDKAPKVPFLQAPDGFIIDNADKPTERFGFGFDTASSNSQERLRIVSAFAEAVDISPEDELDRVAPGMLKRKYQYDNWATWEK